MISVYAGDESDFAGHAVVACWTSAVATIYLAVFASAPNCWIRKSQMSLYFSEG